MSLIHLPPNAAPEDAIRSVRANGYVIVDRLVSDAEMDVVQSEMRPYIEKTTFVHPDEAGRRTKRTGALVARSPAARSLVMNELVRAVCAAIIPGKNEFQLSLTEIISILPGAKAQPIHRDEVGFGSFDFPTDYCPQVATLWAMSDYTEEMGATRIISGSHTLPADIKFELSDTVPAEMERGSVLIYTGKLYHGGGENVSDKPREGINIAYNASWLRQEENQYLSTPRDIARTLPHDLLKLMGYSMHRGNLGRVEDWIDPLSFIVGDPRAADVDEGYGLMDIYEKAPGSAGP